MQHGGKISPRGAKSGVQLNTYQLDDVTTSVPVEGDFLQNHNGFYVPSAGWMGYYLSSNRSTTSTTESSLLGVTLPVTPNTIYRFRMQLMIFFISTSYTARLHMGSGLGTSPWTLFSVTSTGQGTGTYTTYGNTIGANQITDAAAAGTTRYVLIEGTFLASGGATSWNPGWSVSAVGAGIQLNSGSYVEAKRVVMGANGGNWA